MMTNVTKDLLWKNAAGALPNIERDLRIANKIACARELYNIGELDRDDYSDLLKESITLSGYIIKE